MAIFCIVRTDCRRRFLGHQLPFLPATRPDITNKRLLVLQSFYNILSTCQDSFFSFSKDTTISLTKSTPAKSVGLGETSYSLNPYQTTKLIKCFSHSIRFTHSHHITHKPIILNNPPRVSSITKISIVFNSFHMMILQ